MGKDANYYRILKKYGLSENASFEDLRNARRRELSKSHPDKVGSAFEEKAKEINNDFLKVFLDFQLDEFSKLIDAHKNRSTDKEVLAVCDKYKSYLPRIKFSTELSQYQLRFENEIEQLYAKKNVKSTVSRTTDENVEKEKIKFRTYLEELKKKNYFNNSILQLINETFYDSYKYKDLVSLNKAKEKFEKEFLFHLKEFYIREISKKTKNIFDDELLVIKNDFVALIKRAIEPDSIRLLYDEFDKKFTAKVFQLRKRFHQERQAFVEQLEKAKETSGSKLQISIIKRYLELVLHVDTISKLDDLKKAYYLEIERLQERIKNTEFESERQSFVSRLLKESKSYSRYNNVVLKISDYITKAKVCNDAVTLHQLIEKYDKEIIEVIKNNLIASVEDYHRLMTEEINRASTTEELSSIQERMNKHILHIKSDLDRAKDTAKEDIKRVFGNSGRDYDLKEIFAAIDVQKTITGVINFKNQILNIRFSPKKTASANFGKRTFSSVEDTEYMKATR